jgi:hypothetical protein
MRTLRSIPNVLTRLRVRNVLPVVVALVLAACGGDGSATGPGGDPSGPGGGSGGNVPSEVHGDWKFGTISMLSFWDDHTGDYLGSASGVAVFFTFQPNGRYKQLVYVLARSYGCVQQTWTEMEGGVDFDDGTFTVSPARGKYKASDNCNAHNNFQRSMTASELANVQRTFLWRFETNEFDGKRYLMVGHDANTWSSFQRAD